MGDAIDAEPGSFENAMYALDRIPTSMMADVVLWSPQPAIGRYERDKVTTRTENAPDFASTVDVVIEMLQQIERGNHVKALISKRKRLSG